MELVRFGVSMEKELVQLLDDLVERRGSANRSDAIRSLVRRELVRHEMGANPHGLGGAANTVQTVAGVVTLVYQYGHRLKEAPLAPFDSLRISANLQLHLEQDVCLKVLVVQGARDQVQAWARDVVSQRGVVAELSVVATEEVVSLLSGDTGRNPGRGSADAHTRAVGSGNQHGTLQAEDSLVLTHKGRPVFASCGNWLHPLMDLEVFLAASRVPADQLHLYDKMIGRAAALLIARLGICSLETDLLSSRAEPVLTRAGIVFSARDRVDRLDCRTEELLAEVDDPDRAYTLIRERMAAR